MSYSKRDPGKSAGAAQDKHHNYWGWGLKLSQQQSIAAAVDQWITGIPGRIPGHVIFVENPEHTDYAKTLAGEGSTVLVLNGDKSDQASSRYRGPSMPLGKSSWWMAPSVWKSKTMWPSLL